VNARIRQIREARGLSQLALARKAGMNPKYLSQIENGWRAPGLKSLDRLATALDLSIDELRGPTPQPTEAAPAA
jgi:transcriptional regulator with XRE-family HTH domain